MLELVLCVCVIQSINTGLLVWILVVLSDLSDGSRRLGKEKENATNE